MTEFQKIATGLLSLTHPEIFTSVRNASDREPTPASPRAGAMLRALKFAFAALAAGSRIVPMGDNSALTRELGAYGVGLQKH